MKIKKKKLTKLERERLYLIKTLEQKVEILYKEWKYLSLHKLIYLHQKEDISACKEVVLQIKDIFLEMNLFESCIKHLKRK